MTRRLIVGLFVAVVSAGLVACASAPPAAPVTPSASTATTSTSSTVTVETFAGQWGAATTNGATADAGLAENTAVSLVPNGVCSLVEFKVDRNPDGKSAMIVFAATCANARIRGIGSGTVSGDALIWRAEGTLALVSGRTCAFKFVEGNRATPAGAGLVKITYNGTVCGIPVSGAQVVTRK
jgi:hypothetical protein